MPRGRSGGRRSDYSWQGANGQNVAISTVNTLGTGSLVFGGSGTVMRIRGNVLVQMDITSAEDAIAVGLGLILATDAAVTAGALSIPSPATNLDAEWIWHQWVPLRAMLTSNEGLLGGAVMRVEIDTKAMRKFKANSNLVFMIDGVQESGAGTFDVSYGFRALIAD